MGKSKTFLVFAILVSASIVSGEIVLTVNGQACDYRPVRMEAQKNITIGLLGEAETENGIYNLSIVAEGGTLDGTSLSLTKKSDSLQFTTSDPNSVDNITFKLNDGPNTIALMTNSDMVISDLEVSAGSLIYQLIIFNLEEENSLIIFPTESWSLNAPLQENQSVEQEQVILSIPIQQPMESMSLSLPDPVHFDNSTLCPDLKHDGIVDFLDFALFAIDWLESGTGLRSDFDEDGVVALNDLNHIAQYWLTPVSCPGDDIIFTLLDIDSGQLRIGYRVPEGVAPCSIALNIQLSNGATIISATDVLSYDPAFNCFMDYAQFIGAGYTFGTGHPIADTAGPGVPDFGTGISVFSINMASYNDDGLTMPPLSATDLVTLQLYGTGTTNVTISKDTLRNSFDGLNVIWPRPLTVTFP